MKTGREKGGKYYRKRKKGERRKEGKRGRRKKGTKRKCVEGKVNAKKGRIKTKRA